MLLLKQMTTSSFYLRKSFRYFSYRYSLLSSSYSSATHYFQPTNPEKPFYRPSAGHEHSVNTKFIDSIEHLCHQKRLKNAIQLLENHDGPPSAASYSIILQLCIEKRALNEGKRVHNHISRSGFLPGIFISNKMLDLYCKCGSMLDARKLFDGMGERDLCSWNTLISGYTRTGGILEAKKLFDEMPKRDNFSWTAMISGYVKHKQPANALELYRLMQRNENFKCNKFTISSALSASSALQSLRLGKEIHGRIIRTGLDSDAVVYSSLLDVYGKCGNLNEARYIFDKVQGKDIVVWTAMIDRYFGDGSWEEGLSLFSDLLHSNIRPNDYTFAGVLNACSHQAAENLGRQVHGHMMRIGFDPSSFAASALVHMYTKCGCVETAEKVFKLLPNPNLVSWTSLINGYAQNGQPHEALELFETLLESGTQPDHITFVGVISACTHAGLIEKGLKYFRSMKSKHGQAPTPDHYACVVDLLSRAGRFKEAEDVIKEMPMKPDKFLWVSLLSGCRIHGNYELAERAAEGLFETDPKNAATYVTLANIYAAAGKWDEVAKVRRLIDERGVVKEPGQSWISVGKKVHVFLVGDDSHPKSEEIFEFLSEISKRMKEEGFLPQTKHVVHDVEEEQKEQNVFYHSEKLAVAFGIISTPPGTPIKIFKNLRTCVDCHTALKFISKIAERRIIVRDSTRFHCFEFGRCSCHDYW